MAIFDIKDGVLKSCNISWSEKDIVIPDGVPERLVITQART